LDSLLAHFDEGYKISHDEAYRRFSEAHLAPPDDLPADPFSAEYRTQYLDLYKKISSRSAYSVQNERSDFDVDKLTLRPFPYFTKSLKLASLHFTLMGKLFESMDIKENSRILECGFGWGNTTLALAMLGHQVTALDIEERYCEVVRRRAKMLHVENIELINADFLWVETTDQKFDTVIFFESFHHCWEFERLLTALHRILLPGGKIIFGAEPINDSFTTPWGVRLDGESLWVARNAGWMELGFRSDFFDELLSRTGWIGSCVHPHFWIAVPSTEPLIISATDPRIASQVGVKDDVGLNVDAPGDETARHFAMYGPYVSLPKGNIRAELVIETDEGSSGLVSADICCNSGAIVLGERTFDEEELKSGRLRIEFKLTERAENIEFRLQVTGGYKGSIKQLSFMLI
jgi:2-polyprenyl-3-methyl-5-hydroxy-6-metoxy-1,4-benzoquinol methylase